MNGRCVSREEMTCWSSSKAVAMSTITFASSARSEMSTSRVVLVLTLAIGVKGGMGEVFEETASGLLGEVKVCVI